MGDDETPGPEALYAASYARLVGILSLVAASRHEAQDVVQEAFARLLPRWSTVGAYDDPEAWVRKVAFRLLSNRFRAARRLVSGDATDGAGAPGPDGERLDLVRSLARLPLGQRQVIVLHHLFDLSVAEVAHELGVPAGTVKSRLSRGRAALAPLLREDVHDHV